MASVDLNNAKLQEYEKEKNSLINEAQTNYNKTSSGAEQKYNELIDTTKNYGETQADIVQQQTNQTIAEINQNKDKAEKDYIKEQKARELKELNEIGSQKFFIKNREKIEEEELQEYLENQNYNGNY